MKVGEAAALMGANATSISAEMFDKQIKDYSIDSRSVGAGELVFENAPDVMVLDIDMPGVHCFEFLAEIRAEKTIPYFPVVYLTSDVMAATYACQLGAGCVHKPIQPSRLLATIAQTT